MTCWKYPTSSRKRRKKIRLGNNVKLLMSGHIPCAVFSNYRERCIIFFSHFSSIFPPPFFFLCIGLPVNVSTTILPNMTVSLFILNYIVHKVGKLTIAWLLKKSCILCGTWRFVTAFTWAHDFVLWDHKPLGCLACIVAKCSDVLEEALPPPTG